MTILLFGAYGFLGRHVKTRLEQSGHTVWDFSRRVNTLGDTCVSDCDVIINCAGNTENPDSMLEDNTTFVRQLIMAARVFKKRLIHVGSVLEDVPGYSLYKQTKQDATTACLAAATDLIEPVDVCVVKVATLYGAGDKESAFLPTLWRSFSAGTTFTCQDQRRFWIHARDAAAGIEAVLNAPRSKGRVYSLKDLYIENGDLMAEFARAVGVKEIICMLEDAQDWPQQYPGEFPPGWDGPKVSLQDGVREFVEEKWMLKQVWLGAEA